MIIDTTAMEAGQQEKFGALVFQHPKNITVGTGRVLYAERGYTRATGVLPAGWVLPGGQRTDDEARARMVAANIDKRFPLPLN
jgi:hypothetical protein